MKWEIILKCREQGGGEEHTNKPCWRALGQGDLGLELSRQQDKMADQDGEDDNQLYICVET